MANWAINTTQGFPLGINLATSEENIQVGELSQALNAEYDEIDGLLRCAAGIETVIETGVDITSLFYNTFQGVFYYSDSNKNLYQTNLVDPPILLGVLSGAEPPVYALFSGTCLVASGGRLQSIVSNGAFSDVNASPASCSYVNVEMSRAVTFSINSDVKSYSAIGDYTQWANDSADSSSGQSVNVGYGDPGNIIGMDYLSKVCMVYKENGRAYKIVGQPQDATFSIEPVSQTSFCGSKFGTCNIDSYSLFLGSTGMQGFIPVQDYGDVAPRNVGINFNTRLGATVSSDCRMWYVRPLKQIWIKGRENDIIYIYHTAPKYPDGRGATTTRKLSDNLRGIAVAGEKVYLAIGTKISVINKNIDKENGNQIMCYIKSGTRVNRANKLVLRAKNLFTKNNISGNGVLQIGKKVNTLQFERGSSVIYGNNDLLFENNERLYSPGYFKLYRIDGSAAETIQISLTIREGSLSVIGLDYEYLEV